MKSRIALITLFLVLTLRPAFAQFGGVVFDPTNYNNAVLRYLQLQQQLQQLQQTYSLYTQQYQFLRGQAQQLRIWSPLSGRVCPMVESECRKHVGKYLTVA